MIEPLIKGLTYISDKSVSLTTRLLNVIIVLFVLFIINNSLNFLNSYKRNDKLQQLEKIATLLKDTTTTQKEKIFLSQEREKVICTKSYYEEIYSFSLSFLKKFSFKSLIPNFTSKTKDKQVIKSEAPIKNFYLHYLFSSCFVILLAIFIPKFVIQSPTNSNNSLTINILAVLMVWVILLFISFLFTYMFNIVPTFRFVWINYVLDIIFQVVFLAILFVIIDKTIKKLT